MFSCPKSNECVNCHQHFQELRPLVKKIIVSKHFKKDARDFDISQVVDCQHEYFTHLHKFEENIEGNHIFRALQNKTHIVYAIDKQNRLIFLRAFDSFNAYKKFLENKKKIVEMIENAK